MTRKASLKQSITSEAEHHVIMSGFAGRWVPSLSGGPLHLSISVAYEMLGSFSEMTYLKATIARRVVSVMEQRSENSSGLNAYDANIEVVTMKRGCRTLKTQ